MKIVAVIVGGESGVTLADKLSTELKVRSNGIFPFGDRRNKSVQQKAVKAAGMRAVREALGKQWSAVEAFVESEPLPVVVKPVESCGSDGVKLCRTKQEAKEHFNLLMDSQRKVGAQDAAVLVQEFLKGQEYVIDHVSRDGVHKCVMVYVYDKRPTNGAAFVYYGMIPVDAESKEAKILIDYTRGVLDALKLDNGPTHGEVMMTADGPCLVEMNCLLWPYVDAEAFAKIPDVYPSPFKAAGQTVMLVSFFSGIIKSTPGYDKMRKMRSFVALQTGYKVGSEVTLTVDLFSAVGVLILAHADKKVLEEDLNAVREMEKTGLFEFEEEIDPVTYEASPDLNIQRVGSGRAIRTSSFNGNSVKPAQETSMFLPVVVALGVGTLVGILAGKNIK